MTDQIVQALAGFPVEGTMGWVAGWLVRGSLFLALLVLLAAPLARRSSSSVRHLLWVAGFIAALALPLASIGLPRWEVAVPASLVPAIPESESDGAGMPAPNEGEAAPESSPGTMERDSESEFVLDEGVEEEEAAGGSGFLAALLRGEEKGSGPVSLIGETGWDLSRLPLFFFLLWMAGAAFFLLRFGASVVGTAGIVRRAERIARPDWERLLFELSDRMGLADAPRLVESEEVVLPMTCSLLRPTIVLPRSAVTWSSERLEAVLCHELAHIRRRDLLSHLLGHIGSALYWVNPLSWKAARHLRAEGERACDDLVLSLGYRPSVYADHLLQIATSGHRSAAPIAALPMARPGEFEQRLLSILAPVGDRSRPQGWRAAGLALGVVAMAVPFAVFAPAMAKASDGPSKLAASAEHDTILTMSVDVHVPASHPVPEPHSTSMNSGGLGVRISGVNARPCVGCSGSGSGAGSGAGSGFDSDFDVDVQTSLNFGDLAAFVQGVTRFASAVATEAVAEAFEELNSTVSVSVDTHDQDQGQDQVEGTFERTLSLTGPLNLEVGTGSGGIDIREGSVNRIEIRARVRVGTRRRGGAGAEAVLRQLITSPPIEQSGNTVRIGRIEDRSLQEDVSISYELVVPVRSTIAANTGSGGVTIRGVQGDVRANTGSGSVSLAAIQGGVFARTGSGGIRASQISGSFDGETGSGSIRLTLEGSGDVSLSTGSGSIEATGVRGALRAESGSGGIDVEGEMRGRWELVTGSGSVTVGLPDLAAFNLVARAGSGSVNVDHPLTIQGRIDERRQQVNGTVRGGGPELNIRTGSGGIRIE